MGRVVVGDVLAGAISVFVVAGFGVLAVDDVKTSTVIVRRAQALTALALGGLGLSAVATTNWSALATAAGSALAITTIQAVPYAAQRRTDRAWIGRADVRLSVPFGWTLGYFGIGFAVIGFAVSLAAGLVAAGLTRRQRIPFVPFMTIGLVVGLLWAFLVSVG